MMPNPVKALPVALQISVPLRTSPPPKLTAPATVWVVAPKSSVVPSPPPLNWRMPVVALVDPKVPLPLRLNIPLVMIVPLA